MARALKILTEGGFEAVAQRFRLMGDPLRLRLLNCLREGERTVGELVGATGASQPNVSRHLSLLYQNGLVTRRQEGNCVYYGVADPGIFEVCDVVCSGLERDLDARRKVFTR
ncbi:MAG: helix-turn-helix transcriptional regulator [Chrysiogenetes bacterium]|nr:helix-turn-helix transcriptional regulator [Chrysiogenetes bacterium]